MVLKYTETITKTLRVYPLYQIYYKTESLSFNFEIKYSMEFCKREYKIVFKGNKLRLL